jgi:hypothetical protein
MVESKKSFEKDFPLGKKSNEDVRLKAMKELFLQWISKTYMDKNGNLFDLEGNILAKVRFKFIVKRFSTFLTNCKKRYFLIK